MKKMSLAIVCMVLVFASQSQDRYFARTYTSSILPKGSIDLELWHTSRIGHLDEYYHGMDQRMEMEVGLGKNWQTSFYFNRFQERFSASSNGTETENEIGFSNEWKVKLADQGKYRPAIALYGEWSVKGGDELELELKAIFDKSFGKNLIAMNLVGEKELEWNWVNNQSRLEMPTNAEVDLGYLYNFSISFGAGVEVVNRNKMEDGKWRYSVLSAGPSFIYRTARWFALFNYLPQLSNLKRTVYAPAKKELVNNERMEARIIAGISF